MKQKDQMLTNLNVLMELIRTRIRTSQAEMANISGLQPSTVSNLVKVLKKKKLLKADGQGTSGKAGGRKSNLLTMNPDSGYFGGIYVRDTYIISSIQDFSGETVKEKKIPLHADHSGEEIIEIVASEINHNIANQKKYKGTGIAISGVVNKDGSLTIWTDINRNIVDFFPNLKKAVPDVPMAIENDANCSAYHSFFQNKNRYRNLIHFIVHRQPLSFGSGIVLDGKIFYGSFGGAGEIWASDEAIKETQSHEEEINIIKTKLLTAANLLDTEAIFISGDISSLGDESLASLKKNLQENSDRRMVHIVEEENTPIFGASLLASNLYLNQLLND